MSTILRNIMNFLSRRDSNNFEWNEKKCFGYQTYAYFFSSPSPQEKCSNDACAVRWCWKSIEIRYRYFSSRPLIAFERSAVVRDAFNKSHSSGFRTREPSLTFCAYVARRRSQEYSEQMHTHTLDIDHSSRRSTLISSESEIVHTSNTTRWSESPKRQENRCRVRPAGDLRNRRNNITRPPATTLCGRRTRRTTRTIAGFAGVP